MLKTFLVTFADIRAAEGRSDASQCPVAKCLQRNGYPDARVGSNLFMLYGATLVGSMRIPDDVRQRIRIYDNSTYMAPFEFTLDIPE